jgi:hypothetical protein
MSSGAEAEEAGDVAEAVTGAEEAWVAEAGAAEAGVAEAGVTDAGVAEAGVTDAGPAAAGAIEVGGAIDVLSVEAGAGVGGGLSMAMVTGVVAHTVIGGPTAGAVFPSVATATARRS